MNVRFSQSTPSPGLTLRLTKLMCETGSHAASLTHGLWEPGTAVTRTYSSRVSPGSKHSSVFMQNTGAPEEH